MTSGWASSTWRQPSAAVPAVMTSTPPVLNTHSKDWQMRGSSSMTRSFGTRVLQGGQDEGEAGSLARPVRGSQGSPVILGDPAGNGEPQTGSGWLGGVERDEQAIGHGVTDPGSRIGHLDPKDTS